MQRSCYGSYAEKTLRVGADMHEGFLEGDSLQFHRTVDSKKGIKGIKGIKTM